MVRSGMAQVWDCALYFHTMRTPLLSGRNYNSSDSVDAQPVAIVNQILVRKFFVGVNPSAAHIAPWGTDAN
jgi:hypothetical protein